MVINGEILNSKVNVRSGYTTSSTIVKTINPGQKFEGSIIVKDSLGKDWCKVESIDGIKFSGYIALYLTSVKYTIVPDITAEELSVAAPKKVTLIEEFEIAGKIKTRTTSWINPEITES